MIITRIDRRVVPCEDYDPEDLCGCGRALGTHAAVIDTPTDRRGQLGQRRVHLRAL
jgi:hypothetical protein